MKKVTLGIDDLLGQALPASCLNGRVINMGTDAPRMKHRCLSCHSTNSIPVWVSGIEPATHSFEICADCGSPERGRF